jgi:flagellar basal body P-ring formation protein FlgA
MIHDGMIKARIPQIARVVVTCVIVILALFCRASANNESGGSRTASGLTVYLPREVTVKDSLLSLGRVAVIQGRESLVAKANRIALGRISVPGQKIIIDRPTVLSRLACNGIPASMVTLTGAEQITVKQHHQLVSGDEFISAAESFLQKHRPVAARCQWCATRRPEDFLVPGTDKNVRLSARSLENSVANQASVEVNIFTGDRKVGSREVTFGLKYEFREAVTKVDVPAGATISPTNVEIEQELSDSPQPAGWKAPYGLIARRRLRANTVLRASMLEPVASPTVIKRNHSVVIRIERPGFVITAVGKAMQDGKPGEYIKVRNVDSLRIIVTRVNADGSVEPVL